MTSPLESRLLAAIERAVAPDERAIKTAQLACYLARIGEFERADALRIQLRDVYGNGSNVQVSILIMTLEGLLLYFKSLSPDARDRFARAELLSKSFGQHHLVALTSAWLAHVDFNLCRYDSMAVSISTCLDRIAHDDGSAECRVSLVLGDVFLFCDRGNEAQAWYERARRAYAVLGDQASIGAITYNRAALRAANLRLASLVIPVETAQVSAIDLEVSSAVNYQAMVRSRSLDHLLRAARVGVNMVAGRFSDADSEIDQLLVAGVVPDGTSEKLLLLADQAECYARLGDRVNAVSSLKSIESVELNGFPPDDLALVFNSMSNAHRLLGHESSHEVYKQRSAGALGEHRALTDRVVKLIEKFANPAEFKGPI